MVCDGSPSGLKNAIPDLCPSIRSPVGLNLMPTTSRNSERSGPIGLLVRVNAGCAPHVESVAMELRYSAVRAVAVSG